MPIASELRVPRCLTLIVATTAALVVAAAPALAQMSADAPDSGVADVPCAGRRISRITVDAGRPPFEGTARQWRAIARAIGLHHATTRAKVIRTYIVLHEGDVCTDERRAESERILRALPFLAGAAVHVVPDSANDGSVRLHIVTTDEIPALVAGSARHGGPSALALGNSNISGLGIRAFGGFERGYAYRSGAHLDASQYAAFGGPFVASVDVAKDPLGGHAEFGFSHPFLTDLQRGSFQANYRRADDYPTVLRPTGDNTALSVRQERWSVGGVARTRLGGLVALLGAAAMGDRITPGTQAVLITDSGLVADHDTTLRGRYAHFHSARLGGLVGVRRVNYKTVIGYDGLFASQDVMTGLQIGSLVAPGMVMPGHRDVLLANSAYGGVALGRSLIAAAFESETRRDFTGGSWDSMLGSGRAAWYYKPSPRLLLDVDNEFSFGRRGLLPTQLTFNDTRGGVRGYAASRLSGEERDVTRAEVRWAGPSLIRNSDAGVALFADAGTLWAGSVPYGTSASRQSIGLSVLAAYPTGTKRLYRVDFAFPLQRGGTRGIEVRFTSSDPTSAFWIEPDDVSRSRLAPVPSSLFAWPAR